MISSRIEDYLSRFVNLEKTGEFKYARNLTRMQNLLELLGSPEKSLSIRLIAGSKGKTSTSIFLSRLLQSAGRNIGLYTSPHLISWNERIQINGVSVSDEAVESLIPELDSAISQCAPEMRPTYFEISTALAFLLFQRRGINDVVAEVGLGGRYDATNACDPILSVITPISLEHTAVLGSSLCGIAEEKSGIWRQGAPMVIGRQCEEVFSFYRDKFSEKKAEAYFVQTEALCEVSDGLASVSGECLSGPWGTVPLIRKQLIGTTQYENLLTALYAAWKDPLYAGYSPQEFISEMKTKINGIEPVPGRLQVLNDDPVILADGSHNGASAKVLAGVIQSCWKPESVSVILAMMRDKDPLAYMSEFKALPIKRLVVTSTQHYRSFTPEELLLKLDRELHPEAADDLQTALKMLLQDDNDRSSMIVVCGSLYLAGEAVRNRMISRHKVM